MKIILKKGKQFCKILKADFYKNRIIGEMFLLEMQQRLLPHGTEFHSHFIYFENGNYHYSLKYFDEIEHCFIDRKVFHNHISLNKSKTREFNPENAQRFDRDESNDLDRYMLDEKLPPWQDALIAFNFGSFRFATSNVDNLNWVDTIEIKDADILLDIDKFPKCSVNICAAIYTKDKEQDFDLTKILNSKHFESVKEKKNICLKIYALVMPLKD